MIDLLYLGSNAADVAPLATEYDELLSALSIVTSIPDARRRIATGEFDLCVVDVPLQDFDDTLDDLGPEATVAVRRDAAPTAAAGFVDYRFDSDHLRDQVGVIVAHESDRPNHGLTRTERSNDAGDLPRVRKYEERGRECVRSGVVDVYTDETDDVRRVSRFVPLDDSQFEVVSNELSDDESGTPQYAREFVRTPTESEHQAAKLRYERDLVAQIFETSPVGILVLDGDGVVTRANTRATHILGLDAAQLCGQPYEELPLAPSGGSEYPVPFESTPPSEPQIRGRKQKVVTDEGETWVSTNLASMSLDTDKKRVIVTLEDITDRVERERELEAKQAELDATIEELRRSNTELEHFAYVASHDLKEPLRVVSNYLQLLDRRYGDEFEPDAREFVDLAVDGAERMRQRVDDLLRYSRIDRDGDSLEPVDCEEVVDTAISSLEITIRESGADVDVGSLPEVRGDEDQLVQVFQNLIGNAIQAAGEESASVTVASEPDGDEWILRVADEGVGIPEERQDRIFDLFYTGPDSDSTGMGLAICEKIVDRHDGRIWVESTEGEGTTFYVALQATNA